MFLEKSNQMKIDKDLLHSLMLLGNLSFIFIFNILFFVFIYKIFEKFFGYNGFVFIVLIIYGIFSAFYNAYKMIINK